MSIEFVEGRGLGWTLPNGTSFQCFSNRNLVRTSEVSFIRSGRVSLETARSEEHLSIVPDLVVTVVKPTDLQYDLVSVRDEWLEAGVQVVWELFPKSRTIHGFFADGTIRISGQNDTLMAESTLPGFRAPVADLFKLPT